MQEQPSVWGPPPGSTLEPKPDQPKASGSGVWGLAFGACKGLRSVEAMLEI